MTIRDNHGGAGFIPGTRSRHMRTAVIAAVLMFTVWTIRVSPLFRDHYESGFTIVNPDEVPTPTGHPEHSTSHPQGASPPIALPGNSFYLTDALASALHPPPPPPPPPPPFPESAAVIMETDVSAIANLVPLMLHFTTLLGPAYPVILLTHRATWVEPASPSFRRYMRQQRIRIHWLPEETTFPTHDSVSVFLTQPWFWEHFESANRLLLFQADSVVCANSPARVEDFAVWDMVGAPIASQYGAGVNGGLSLRNPRAMLEAIRGAPRSFEEGLAAHMAEIARVREAEGEDAASAVNAKVPSWEKFEDQWFWWRLKEMNAAAEGEGPYKLPTVEAAKGFAVETVWDEKPLGYHQPFRWLNAVEKQKALTWCPELAMLKGESHFF